ncbi:MAG TPA: sulfate ABC transporter permease subunit CysW, partial [Planctomycetota bacterium]|nr:sulfate ABC transporter permease subunit CysW [Planctomycetota bacterium]
MNSRDEAPAWVRYLFLFGALVFVALLLLLPALNVLAQAFVKGAGPYFSSIADKDTLHAIFLTTGVAILAVAVNTVFGVAASWAITKY